MNFELISVVYEFFNCVPYVLLVLYAFRNSLRFNKSITIIMCCALVRFEMELCYLSYNSSVELKSVLSMASTVLYFVFCIVAIRNSFGKLLFSLMIIANIANLIVMLAKYIETLVYTNASPDVYSYSFISVMVVVEIVLLIPLALFVKKRFSIIEEDKSRLWRILWLVPVTFYFVWYYAIYLSNKTPMEFSANIDNMVFMIIISIGSLLVYYLVIALINENHKNVELVNKNHIYKLQSLQYDKIKTSISETRKARHDLRHHLNIINSYLQNNCYDEMRNYLAEYLKNSSKFEQIYYCDNTTLNLILSYFAELAEEKKINYDVKLKLTKQLNINNDDLAVMVSNILENAVDGCAMLEENKRSIKVRGNLENNTFIFTCDNSSIKNSLHMRNNKYVSSKHSGYGVGIDSVKDIVERYDGVFSIKENNNQVCVSILCKLNN